jgi:hypothetical protein
MAPAEKPTTIPPDLIAEMKLRADLASRGVRDPEEMRKAFERMDRMREKMEETNLAVELVREARDQG